MKIELMTKEHSQLIFNFEKSNKDFFENCLPPRPAGYHSLESFNLIMDQLLEEQSRGLCYMHLIMDNNDQMVGRINLHREDKMPKHKMALGYRIGENNQGKGMATQAVKTILKYAKELYDLSEIEAGTSVENIGSKRVLEKNGFSVVGEEKDVMVIRGQSVDGVLYRILL